MSRSQSTDVFKQGRDESKTNFGNSQNSYVKAQEDVGNFEHQLSGYAASDPFTPGGEFQTAENRVLSGVAGGVADSARAELQSGGARRGENPALANAGADAIADKSQRTLAEHEGLAEATRIGKDADYKRSVLEATKFPVEAETGLYRDTSAASNQELDAESGAAAHNQSFGDVFGESFAKGLGDFLTGNAKSQSGVRG